MPKAAVLVVAAVVALLALVTGIEIGPGALSAVGATQATVSAPPDELERETQTDDDLVAPSISVPRYGRSSRFPVEWTFTGNFQTRFPEVVSDARAAARSAPGAIAVTVRSAAPAELKSQMRHLRMQSDAYQLRFADSGIEVVGVGDRGAVFGVTELLRLLEESRHLPQQRTIERVPRFGFRGVHVSMNGVQPDEFRYIVWLARNAGMNTLIVQPTQGVRFESLPGSARDGSMSVAQFRELVKFARESGLELVPELKTLTHQEKVLRNLHPELMLNPYEYDPRRPDTYKLVFKVIDEILEVTGSKAMHIGHDEVVRVGHGGRRRLKPGDTAISPELFLQELLTIHGYLRSKDVAVWMWGDMLLDPEALPSMNPKHLNGDAAFAELLHRIPKDIVIFDWHYFESGTDFPSMTLFTRAGFRTVPSTWRHEPTLKSSAEAARRGGPNVYGMLATTWFHVQRREWSKVERIIEESGNVFWSQQ
jgi:hypothetical protein